MNRKKKLYELIREFAKQRDKIYLHRDTKQPTQREEKETKTRGSSMTTKCSVLNNISARKALINLIFIISKRVYLQKLTLPGNFSHNFF